jgi:colanic acid biosynthesis glycosyl transferase WcaI
MKILVCGVNYHPELTGVGKYSGEMAEWLVLQVHEVRVVTAPPYYPQWRVTQGYSSIRFRREVLNNVDVWRCPLWVPSKPSGLKRILHLASFALSSLPVMLLQVRWRPDVVLVLEPPLFCAPIAALTARLSRGRAWLHVQDFEVDAAFDLGLLQSQRLRRVVLAVERWVMRRFDKVSTISGRMLQRLEAKGVTDSQRVSFPNWVDTDLIYPMKHPSPFRDELGIGPQDVVALYSGNMGQKQGLEIVIEAARILASENNVRFVMCGQGAAYARLREMAEGLANIIWIPLQPMERLNELLNLADIHLLPQSADAADLVMPSKLTGMLASGRPVVATAAEGTEVWSVVEGRGINTLPGDVSAFVDGMLSLARSPERRAALGQSGRAYAEEYLGRDKVLARFEAELLRLVCDSIA